MTPAAIVIPSNTDVIEAARLADAQHLHLLIREGRTVLSPVVLPGWTRLGVNRRTPTQEVTSP